MTTKEATLARELLAVTNDGFVVKVAKGTRVHVSATQTTQGKEVINATAKIGSHEVSLVLPPNSLAA